MPSYKVNLQGGGDMTVNASSPAAAIANVIAEGGTPQSNSPVALAGSSSGTPPSAGTTTGSTPQFNKDLTIAFVILVLCGIAIAVSSWQNGAKFVQWGLVVAIVVVLLRGEPQLTRFLSFLNPTGEKPVFPWPKETTVYPPQGSSS